MQKKSILLIVSAFLLFMMVAIPVLIVGAESGERDIGTSKLFNPVSMVNFRPDSIFSLAPRLLSPDNGATVDSLIPTFTWQRNFSLPRYTYVDFEISPDQNFSDYSTMSWAWGLSSEGYAYPWDNLDESTIYYYRANYFFQGNVGGNWWWETGPYSEVRSFTTGSGFTIPGQPQLNLPVDGAVINTSPVTFSWQPVAGAVEYELVCLYPCEFNGQIYQCGRWWLGIETNIDLGLWLQPNTTYTWRVRARSNEAWGYYSQRSFTTSANISFTTTRSEEMGRAEVFILDEAGRQIPLSLFEDVGFPSE